jgi:hypothetical protein
MYMDLSALKSEVYCIGLFSNDNVHFCIVKKQIPAKEKDLRRSKLGNKLEDGLDRRLGPVRVGTLNNNTSHIS